MRRVGKSWSALVALVVAAVMLVATPSPTPAQGDEYDLNIPTGGNEEAPAGGGDTGGGGGESTEEETAPVAPTAPVVPTTPAPTTEAPVEAIVEDVGGSGGGGGGGGREPERLEPEPVFGSTSLNASIGPQRIPTLKVPQRDESASMLPLGLAGLAGLCCLIAVWRLRYLRELPTAARPPGPAKPTAALARVRSSRESSAAARVRAGRKPPVSRRGTVQHRHPAGGAASS